MHESYARRVSPGLSKSEVPMETDRFVDRIGFKIDPAENIIDTQRGLWRRADRPPGLHESPEVPTE